MCGAALFAKGGGKEIAVGVVIVVVFPALMVLGAAYLVWAHILRSEKRKAAWVLLEDPETSVRVSTCTHLSHCHCQRR